PYSRNSRSRTSRSAAKGRHHLACEPAQLLLELLRRQALGPMDHEIFQTGILRLDRFDALDHMGRRSAEPRLLRDPVGEVRNAGGRAGRAPRAPLLVRVPHEAEGREPLVSLVVRRLHTALGFFGRAGEIDAGAPDDVLAQLLLLTMLGARVAVRRDDVVEDLF